MEFEKQYDANLTICERADLLDKVQWAQGLKWQQAEILARFLYAWKIPKDITIFREGDLKSYMCLIIAGRISVTKMDSARNDRPISVLGRGQTFGEMMLLDGEARSASVHTLTDALLFVLTKECFLNLIEEYPQIANHLLMKLAQLMSRRLRMVSGMLVESLEHGEAS